MPIIQKTTTTYVCDSCGNSFDAQPSGAETLMVQYTSGAKPMAQYWLCDSCGPKIDAVVTPADPPADQPADGGDSSE